MVLESMVIWRRGGGRVERVLVNHTRTGGETRSRSIIVIISSFNRLGARHRRPRRVSTVPTGGTRSHKLQEGVELGLSIVGGV
jgi:hypothetical protein